MLDQVEDEIVDTRVFERARAELGSAFLRILGYFREDGVKAVDRIEHAMRTGDSASLVLPAHTLKGEARHFGALSLGDLAETIEMGARRCVDHQETPEELLVPVARMRSMFEQTLAWFDKETNPMVARRKQPNHASTIGRAAGRGR